MDLIEFKPYKHNSGLTLPQKCLYTRKINGFYVPCGKCEFCRMNKAREWSFRLESEAFDNFAYNCLLTYDDAHLPYYKGKPSVNRVDVQLFLKRLREAIRKRFGVKIKFFLCGEYGGNYHRPHYHMILFSPIKLVHGNSNPYKLINDILNSCWSKGITDIEPLGSVGGSVHYLTSYMTSYSDGIEYDEHNKPFLQMSRCGLGKNWLDNHPNQVKKMVNEMDYSTVVNGHKVSIPRYLKRKIQPEEQRIAFADAYYDYSQNFENQLNKLSYEERNKLFKQLKAERIRQYSREREQYRKGKIHSNNSNTSQLSRRAETAEKLTSAKRTPKQDTTAL